MTFEAFPKIPRLSRQIIVTEKIDGTNAQIIISTDAGECVEAFTALVDDLFIWAGSRSRIITPGKTTDNFGFAGWVKEHAAELVKLGIGRHFGEWYGQGIQRSYGLTEKRFALFNVSQWLGNPDTPACCHVVPMLYTGPFDTNVIDAEMDGLRSHGSRAVPGFMNPEGIIVYHTAARSLFKKTFDDAHKEAA